MWGWRRRIVWVMAWVTVLVAVGCSTTEEQRRDDDSPLPWNKPERWEQQPNFGAPYAW